MGWGLYWSGYSGVLYWGRYIGGIYWGDEEGNYSGMGILRFTVILGWYRSGGILADYIMRI